MTKIEIDENPTRGISLILATLGRTDELDRFFNSILASMRVEVEVIVVDQNGDDRLNPIIQSAQHQGISVNHIRVTRKGLSYARNIGLRAARYDIVGFPDDDCWYEPLVCESINEEFISNKNLDGLVIKWMDRHDTKSARSALNTVDQKRFRGIQIASICLFFRTQVVRRANGFDEHFGVGEWYGSSEETDLVLSILDSGHHIIFCPEIGVRHFWSGKAINITGGLKNTYHSAKLRARGTGAIYIKHSLNILIILKGLNSPLARLIINRDGFHGIAYWLGTCIGRWQGLISWRFGLIK